MRELTHFDAEIERRASAAVGTVLDRKWRLDRLLGCGGMGAVYSATHRNGTRAAVKVLHPEAALSPALRRRFLREGYVANKVEHEGAVSILDDDVDEVGNAYLVMELLNGETLETRLARSGGKLPPAEVIQIACGVLDCLEAAHARGIVHRDIKPGNLFLTIDGGVKVLDFGIARLSESRGKRGDTTGVQALGTPDFMPPEQARGHWDLVDGQSDVFAVGAVMLYALTAEPLREAPTTNEQLLKAMTEPMPSLSTLMPGASELLVNLVDRALAFDKDERWPSAAAFRQAARAAYGSIAEHPIERAPKLSVRPVPTGPQSLMPAPGASPFDSHDPIMSMPVVGVSSRGVAPTKIVTARRGPRIVRVALVGVAAAGLLFAMTFRVGRTGRQAAPARVSTLVARPEPQAAAVELSVASTVAVPVAVPVAASAAAPSQSAAPSAPVEVATTPAPPNTRASSKKTASRRTHATKALAGIEAKPAADPSSEAKLAGTEPPSAPAPSAAPTPVQNHAVDLFSRRK